jgi:hypothetical protein
MHLAAVVGASIAVLASIIVYRLLPSTNPHMAAHPGDNDNEALVAELGPVV